jgi:hypothetical protein
VPPLFYVQYIMWMVTTPTTLYLLLDFARVADPCFTQVGQYTSTNTDAEAGTNVQVLTQLLAAQVLLLDEAMILCGLLSGI